MAFTGTIYNGPLKTVNMTQGVTPQIWNQPGPPPGYNPGSGGGYGGGIDIASILAEARKAYGQANEANERRYQEMLRRMQEREANAENYGNAQIAGIRKDFENKGTQAAQQMTSRGLSGTTIAPTVQAGIARQGAQAGAQVAENVSRYKNDLIGDTVGVMERREDVGQDMMGLLPLLMQYGQSGGGQPQPQGGTGGGVTSAGGGQYIPPGWYSPTSKYGPPDPSRTMMGQGGFMKAVADSNDPNPRPSVSAQAFMKNPLNMYRAWGGQ